MDLKSFREATLAYYAVYDQDLREEMEELGMISESVVDEERAPGVKPYRPNPTQAEVRAGEREARKKQVEKAKDQSGYGPDEKFKDWKDRSTPSSTLKRRTPEGGTRPETVSQRMNREKPYANRMTGPMAREYGSRHAAAVTRVIKGAGEPQAVTYPRKGVKEGNFDVYDIILFHLLDEGYAETPEAAEVIMVNMSEDWRDGILQQLDEISQRVVNSVVRQRQKQLNRGYNESDWSPTPDLKKANAKSKNLNKTLSSREQRIGRSQPQVKNTY